MYAHTKSITGDLANVDCLVEAGAEPHGFQFKPSDLKKIQKASLLVMNGVGIEDWLDKPLEKFKSSKVIVNASEGIDLLENSQVLELTAAHKGHDHSHDHKCEGHHHGDGKNPHTWIDPVNASIQVKNILKGLQKVDPKNADQYSKNADLYLKQLDLLDQDFKSQVSTLPNKSLITFHDAFPYLAKRYGFRYLGAVEDFPEKSPSPKVLKEMIDLIKKNQVSTIFTEEGYSQKSLASIARESGAKIATLDTLEVGTPSADAFLKGMRNNLNALKNAWGSSK